MTIINRLFAHVTQEKEKVGLREISIQFPKEYRWEYLSLFLPSCLAVLCDTHREARHQAGLGLCFQLQGFLCGQVTIVVDFQSGNCRNFWWTPVILPHCFRLPRWEGLSSEASAPVLRGIQLKTLSAAHSRPLTRYGEDDRLCHPNDPMMTGLTLSPSTPDCFSLKMGL